MVKVNANTTEKTKAHRAAHDIRIMKYPHENIIDLTLYTSATPRRTQRCIESLREIGSSSLDESQQ